MVSPLYFESPAERLNACPALLLEMKNICSSFGYRRNIRIKSVVPSAVKQPNPDLVVEIIKEAVSDCCMLPLLIEVPHD